MCGDNCHLSSRRIEREFSFPDNDLTWLDLSESDSRLSYLSLDIAVVQVDVFVPRRRSFGLLIQSARLVRIFSVQADDQFNVQRKNGRKKMWNSSIFSFLSFFPHTFCDALKRCNFYEPRDDDDDGTFLINTWVSFFKAIIPSFSD